MVSRCVPLGDGLANLNGRDSRSAKTGKQFVGIVGMGKHEKAAGGLRIEENVLHVGRDGIRNVADLCEKVPIAREPARTKTSPAVFQGAAQDRNFSMIDSNRNVTGFRHFARVPDKAESGDVRHCIDSELQADFRRATIEFKHHIDGGLNVFG